jgi:hypothetical protein
MSKQLQALAREIGGTYVEAAGSVSLPENIIAKIDAGKEFSFSQGRISGSKLFRNPGIANPKAQALIEKYRTTAEYWIYSFATPIIAKVNGEWKQIPGKYSSTTTRHQNGLYAQLGATTAEQE